MQPYKMPLGAATADFTEKKSRFICNIAPVSTEEEAQAFLSSIREKHRDATHNVYAYRIKNGGFSRCSDDGEPSGTAGMPLLETFTKQDIYDFCCVATRYFGGVLLGTGGLIRAYARCGSLALEASGIGTMREVALCEAALPYALFEAVKRLLNAAGAENISEEFGAEVVVRFTVFTDDAPELQRKIVELTAGTVRISIEGNKWARSG